MKNVIIHDNVNLSCSSLEICFSKHHHNSKQNKKTFELQENCHVFKFATREEKTYY